MFHSSPALFRALRERARAAGVISRPKILKDTAVEGEAACQNYLDLVAIVARKNLQRLQPIDFHFLDIVVIGLLIGLTS